MRYQSLKAKRMLRWIQKQNHTKRQASIWKTNKHDVESIGDDFSDHYFHKKSAMACGDPNCVMCGNPRKFFGEKTIQEKKAEIEDPYELVEDWDEEDIMSL